MYKTAAKNWLRIGKSVSKNSGVKSSRLTEKQKKAQQLERAKQRQIEFERKQRELVKCSVCQTKFPLMNLYSHYFMVHDLSTCKFCRKLIPKDLFHQHIEKTHGSKLYNEWLDSKPTTNAKKQITKVNVKSVKLTIKPLKKKIEKTISKRETVSIKCKNCNYIVDSKQMDLHNKQFCSGKNKR